MLRLLAVFVVLLSLALSDTRTYNLQAESFVWDYAPSGKMQCANQPFNEGQSLYAVNTPDTIGPKNKKAHFVPYTDKTFKTAISRPASELHMGLVSSPIRAEVGDTVIVIVRNKLEFPIHFYPGFGAGQTPTTEIEGIAPGATFTYTFVIPESAGPGPADPSSVVYVYRSDLDKIHDMYSGLIGPFVVYRAGHLVGGKAFGIDTEQFAFFWVSDESYSHYEQDNIKKYLPRSWEWSEDYAEGNKKHAINGFIFCNNPNPFTLNVMKTARWYMASIGSDLDIHTPHWHGNVVHLGSIASDVIEIVPLLTRTVDMVPEIVQTWLFHCHVNDHLDAGMVGLYSVVGQFQPTPTPTNIRKYFLRAHKVEWDYIPSGLNQCGSTPRAFNPEEAVVAVHLNGTDNPEGLVRIGSKFIRARYTAYTDATFSTPIVTDMDAERGLLGPVLRAEVGDAIQVMFRNDLEFTVTAHPHSVLYQATSEGAPYVRPPNSMPSKKANAVEPGQTVTQIWHATERSGPSPSQGSSIAWLYHSHFDETRDTVAGLSGLLVISRKGSTDANLKPKDVDREVFALVQVYHEGSSLYFDENVKKYVNNAESSNPDDFDESTLKPTINGYMFCNMPTIVLKSCERVRWYVAALGTESDAHSMRWDRQIVKTDTGDTTDTVMFFPATMRTIDHIPQIPDYTWLWGASSNDQALLGEQTKVKIIQGSSSTCAPPSNAGGKKRTFYIQAESLLWDYMPSGQDLCSNNAFFANVGTDFEDYFDPAVSSIYQKDQFVQYTDDSFTVRAPKPVHEGILGPTLRMEVGDNVKIVFRNNLKRPVNIHPNGVTFDHDNNVQPGSTITYSWNPTPLSGPKAGSVSSHSWIYESSAQPEIDSNGGLFGALLVYAPGTLKKVGPFKYQAETIDHEYVLAVNSFEEAETAYGKDLLDDTSDLASFRQIRYAINGYSFCNLPGLAGLSGQRVRFHFLAVGDYRNFLSVFMESHVFDNGLTTSYTAFVLPGLSPSVDVTLANVGVALISSAMVNNGPFGSNALFTILDGVSKTKPCPFASTSPGTCEAHCEAEGFAFGAFQQTRSDGCHNTCLCACKPATSNAACSKQCGSKPYVLRPQVSFPIKCSGVCTCM